MASEGYALCTNYSYPSFLFFLRHFPPNLAFGHHSLRDGPILLLPSSRPAPTTLPFLGVLHALDEGLLRDLPKDDDGGNKRVAEMILHGTRLELDPMKYFGRFPNLRSLVLADHAYVGTHIFIYPLLFPCLRSLKLQNLQNLETMEIAEEAMPLLFSLQIESCNLVELTIPEKLFHRLKKIGGDAYSVLPSPSRLKLISSSHHQFNFRSRG